VNKPRVAILGGGVGGVVAAFALSAPGWESHLDSITLYQQGW
jgi:glycine/D-amino acid oxidase-like deaminating enzyme